MMALVSDDLDTEREAQISAGPDALLRLVIDIAHTSVRLLHGRARIVALPSYAAGVQSSSMFVDAADGLPSILFLRSGWMSLWMELDA